MLSGCGPTSDCPLIDANHAEQDLRLYGSWVSDEEKSSQEQTFLHIGEDISHERDPDELPGRMQAWWISTGVRHMTNGKRKKEERTWNMNMSGPPIGVTFTSTRIGEAWIASITTNVDVPESVREVAKDNELQEIRDRFWFMKYEVDGDKLSLWRMDEAFVCARSEMASFKARQSVSGHSGKYG